jgi:hypothetical protein
MEEEKLYEIDKVYGKDITSLIKQFIFLKCLECKKYKEFNGENKICNDCNDILEKSQCRDCENYFILKYNYNCRYCYGTCKVYCLNCREELRDF